MSPYEPDGFSKIAALEDFSLLSRVGLSAGVFGSWDDTLLREPRVCVPIDVQALVVPPSDPDLAAGVRLTGPLSPGSGLAVDASDTEREAALIGPDAFADAAAREPGVHVHWAMPDSLMGATLRDPSSGEIAESPSTAGGGLGMTALPDRWLVLRLLLPESGTAAVSTGWVIDALTGSQVPLADWAGAASVPDPSTASLPAEGLTGVAGGTATWTAGYDAARGRFTFHDPLEDLTADPTLGGALPGGPVDHRATYLVVGWWSVPELDPLDEVRGSGALDRRLATLKWYRAPLAEGPTGGAALPEAPFGSIGPAYVSELDFKIGRRFGDLVTPTSSLFAGAGLRETKYVAPTAPPRPEASALLHGAVLGVPVLGDDLAERVKAADQRPDPERARPALGETLYDAVGAMTAASAAARLGVDDPEQRGILEQIMVAFVQHSVHKLADPSGAAEIDEDEHAAGFVTVASDEPGIEDRVIDRKTAVPPRGRRIGVAGGKGIVGGIGTGTIGPRTMNFARAKEYSFGTGMIAQGGVPETAARAASNAAPQASTAPAVRTEVRPAPNLYVPSDPYLAIRGAGRALRHGGDGRWSSDGKLLVRHPSQLTQGFRGLITGAQVLSPLASGAIPSEATALAREALLLSPHAVGWLSALAARLAGGQSESSRGFAAAVAGRLQAELLLRFDGAGRYTPFAAADTEGSRSASSAPYRRSGDVFPDVTRLADALLEQSLLVGTAPSPVGITAWAQPWCPLWLEYTAEISSTDVATMALARTAGAASQWRLGATDLEPTAGPVAAPVVLTVSSRVPLTTGAASAIGGAVEEYIVDEATRDKAGDGEIDDSLSARLGELSDVAGAPDLLGAALDGIRRRLLGLPARAMRGKAADGSPVPPTPDATPTLLVAGRARITAIRLLDTFGRVLEIDPARAIVPSRLAVPGEPGALLRPPRFTAPTRVRLRLVGAEATSADGAVDARVDEVEPARSVNPVAGFLLPDHVDESLEIFTADGSPLGELLVEGAGGTSGGGVGWEPAPGRPVPHDAAPGTGLAPAQASLGRFATGIVLADAAARQGKRAVEGEDSALSALLRAIDTTLWTVDPLAGTGSADLAAIVGRPLAVVRALVQVDIADDLDDLTLTDAARADRANAYRELVQVGVRVRLGELTRPDDGLVAWFADDDFSRVHLVDAAVADLARPSGAGHGYLTEWGLPPESDVTQPITHPYVVRESELVVHPGLPRAVTLLMAPGASVYFTSGIVPRGRVQLQRSWFGPALDRLMPSIRVGPVLIDPGDVRLPLVAALGATQTLTTREGPIGWRDDAILAASSSAILPDRATVLREGWVRVSPEGDGAAPE